MINTKETANVIVNILLLGFSIFMITIFILIWVNTNKIVDNTKKYKDEFSDTIEDDDYKCLLAYNHPCCANNGIKSSCNDIDDYCKYNDKTTICEDNNCSLQRKEQCSSVPGCKLEKKRTLYDNKIHNYGDKVNINDENTCDSFYVQVLSPSSIRNDYVKTIWDVKTKHCIVGKDCYNPQTG